jgi:hypothetical protein
MKNKLPNSSHLIVLLLILTTLGIGCAVSSSSKNLAAQFGKLSSELASTAEPLYVNVRKADENARISTALNRETVSSDLNRLTPAIPIKTIQLRISVLGEIGKYGQALQILSSDNELDRISKASTELNDSLGALNKTVGGALGNTDGIVSVDSLKIISTAVNAIGGWYFEKKRLEALITVTSKAEPIIQNSISLLQSELESSSKSISCPPDTEAWRAIMTCALATDAKNMIKLANNMNDKENPEEVELRDTLIKNAAALSIRKELVDAEFQQFHEGLGLLAKAHTKLVKALENDENLDNAIEAISIFSSKVSSIKAFYKSLGKEQKQE